MEPARLGWAGFHVWESFWVGGVRRGALFRSFDGVRLTVRVAFDDGVGAPFAAQSLLSVGPETWDACAFRQEPGGLRTELGREAAGLGADTLPSSGEYLLVARIAESSRGGAEFGRIDEAQPDAGPAPARVRRRPGGAIDFPDGRIRQAERLDVVAGGMRVATYWAVGGVVVRSAWAGALTFLCTEAEALEGLDPGISSFLRQGFVAP
ncbi:hypothetical protein SPF06_06095 [Sinomonas sp. JGH33]|uniref:Uncharacterized protein n=1 Tax=Sinomonas terricola TaxID=3110330 RepID=A0ABU5T3P4_9MICC|nr:hypothetical protein [Sinomonas sp. JGH33]MEA5454293.1 hypothetical protein [Sinomonas sp. JGH33]